ncbi:flightin [Ostrinia furnacalis]|uniref:flightin n=1 Tax=Ostrinia furnacalis TaxID=93504 RepID=UPI00103CC856|nr:flightin [Ostrinia furnacalis]
MHGRRIDRKSLAAYPTNRVSACDSQVGSKGDNLGGCVREQGTAAPVVDERSSTPHVFPNLVREPPIEMWDDADIEEETKAAEPEPEAAPEAAAPAAEAAPEAEPPAPENIVMGTEPRKLIFKHWIRPKFLQYTYLYDYQHNYYDDVINYLDRRNKGLPVEKPRAQTWGERALRTYLSKSSSSFSSRSSNRDSALLRHISAGARFHRYHSKSLISRKYSKLGFNTVSI